jgi:hypothetical protein
MFNQSDLTKLNNWIHQIIKHNKKDLIDNYFLKQMLGVDLNKINEQLSEN